MTNNLYWNGWKKSERKKPEEQKKTKTKTKTTESDDVIEWKKTPLNLQNWKKQWKQKNTWGV